MERYFPNCQREDRGELRGGQRTGKWQFWSPEGTLLREGEYRAGRMEGPWRFYDRETGQLVREGPYVQGQRDGVFREFFATGAPWHTVTYQNGKRLGPEAEHCPYPKGEYLTDPSTRREGCLIDGREEGLWLTFEPSGSVSRKELFRSGRREGLVEEFYPDGGLLHRGEYRGGAPEGKHQFFAADGALKSESVILDGSGAWRAFDSSGRTLEEDALRATAPTASGRASNSRPSSPSKRTSGAAGRKGPGVSSTPVARCAASGSTSAAPSTGLGRATTETAPRRLKGPSYTECRKGIGRFTTSTGR